MNLPTRLQTFRTALPALLLGALALAAVLYAGSYLYWNFFYTYTPPTMTTLSGKTQTHCVGRYLIDVPVEFGPANVDFPMFYYGLDRDFKIVEVKMATGDYTQARFMQESGARLDELKTVRNTKLNIPLLLHSEVIEGPAFGRALLLRYLKNKNTVFSSVKSEIHLRINNRYVVLIHASYDERGNMDTDRVAYKFIDPAPAEARLKRIAMNLRGYTDPLRAGEGFCMNGVVFDPRTMGYDEERGSLSFVEDTMGLALSISMLGKTGQSEETLLQRAATNYPVLEKVAAQENAHLRQLRFDLRKLNGMPAQEVVTELYTQPGNVEYGLNAENRMPSNSWQRPHINVEMNLGRTTYSLEDPKQTINTTSPLDAQQTLHMWDALLNSLRLSPANGGLLVNPSTGELDPAPTAKSGQPAPRTGLYRGMVPPDHRDAAHFESSRLNYHFVQKGEPLTRLGGLEGAEQDLVTWTWLRATREE